MLRAYKICDPDKLDSEIDYVKKAFLKLGYAIDFINKAHTKARKTFYGGGNNDDFIKDGQTLLIIPQTNSGDEALNKYLKNCGVVGVYKNTNTVKKYLSNIENKPESRNKPCIYKIPCNECDKMYIGETIDITRRKREHRDALRRGDVNSAIFQHLQNTEHRINIDNISEITTIENKLKRKIIESILIQNCNTFNLHQSNYKLDAFINNICKNHVTSVNKLVQHTNRPPEIE